MEKPPQLRPVSELNIRFRPSKDLDEALHEMIQTDHHQEIGLFLTHEYHIERGRDAHDEKLINEFSTALKHQFGVGVLHLATTFRLSRNNTKGVRALFDVRQSDWLDSTLQEFDDMVQELHSNATLQSSREPLLRAEFRNVITPDRELARSAALLQSKLRHTAYRGRMHTIEQSLALRDKMIHPPSI